MNRQSQCKNCQTQLRGAFCHDCGQKDVELERPVQQLIGDAVRETLDVDGRAARTLSVLLTRPGNLTVCFLAGRRQHYTPPIRLYLIVSLFFFLFVAWVVSRGFMFEVETAGSAQVRVLTEQLPQMMFILLPVFALLLRVLYPKRLYIDHLVHALHLHAAAYIALVLLLPFERAAGYHWALLLLQVAIFVYIGVYVVVSLRKVYGSGWLAAVSKTLILLVAYTVMLAMSLEMASEVGL